MGEHHNNSWVQQAVKGITIELDGLPGQTITPTSDSGNDDGVLETKVSEMLSQGVIEKAVANKRRFVSHLFLRPKNDGDFRPLQNLSKLNERVTYRHFKMEQLGTVMQLIHKGACLASLDISQAYDSLEIREADRALLQFIHKGKRDSFQALPNGLSLGPCIFTKIM